MILDIAVFVFIVMEVANVLIMYFKPDFKYGNSMAIFTEWSASKENETGHLFVKYLVRWVANCKLIFIVLLLVIFATGTEAVKVYGILATIASIGIYFVSLHPIIRQLDLQDKITPQGYSAKLGMMIAGFMVMFSIALALHFVFDI